MKLNPDMPVMPDCFDWSLLNKIKIMTMRCVGAVPPIKSRSQREPWHPSCQINSIHIYNVDTVSISTKPTYLYINKATKCLTKYILQKKKYQNTSPHVSPATGSWKLLRGKREA